jgi:hypothetical protein
LWGKARSRLASILVNVVRVQAMPACLPDVHSLRYLTSAIRTSPTMTSGIPFVNSRTLFLTQSATFGKRLIRGVEGTDGDDDALRKLLHRAVSHSALSYGGDSRPVSRNRYALFGIRRALREIVNVSARLPRTHVFAD